MGLRESLPQEVAMVLQPWFPKLDLGKVRLVRQGFVCWLVRTVIKKAAMTVSYNVFLGTGSYDPTNPYFLALLAHELKHVEQFQQYGFVGFLVRYFWDLMRNGFRYSPDLPLEAEAYDLERRFLASLIE
jgi:hypothetical protein